MLLDCSQCVGEGITEVEGDIQRPVMVDGDLVDEFRQERSSEGVDVAVVLEVVDKRVCLRGCFRAVERVFEMCDALLQACLLLLIILLIDQVLILVEDARLVVGVEIRHQRSYLFQFLFTLLQLNSDAFGSAVRTALTHFFDDFIRVDGDIHHLLDTVQHAVVQSFVADGVGGAGGFAFAMG